MIRTESINHIPELAWTEYSLFELASYDDKAKRELLSGSKYVKLIFNDKKIVMLAGIFRGALISVPYFWSLVTPEFKSLSVGDLRSLVHELGTYGPVETLVNESFLPAVRLARIFQFAPTSYTCEINNVSFRMFRRDK